MTPTNTANYALKDFTFRSSFRGVFDQYAEYDGLPFTVVSHIPHPDCEPGCLGMFRITIEGETITAHPEEVVSTLCGLPYRVYCGGVER